MWKNKLKRLRIFFANRLFAYLECGFKGMVKSFENGLSAMAADLATNEIRKFLFGSVATSALKGSSRKIGSIIRLRQY